MVSLKIIKDIWFNIQYEHAEAPPSTPQRTQQVRAGPDSRCTASACMSAVDLIKVSKDKCALNSIKD